MNRFFNALSVRYIELNSLVSAVDCWFHLTEAGVVDVLSEVDNVFLGPGSDLKWAFRCRM